MKFADKNPPETKGMWNLNIESYYYYLSFLERFIEETKSIPTDLRKVYLVRAEYRYIKWMHVNVYLSPPTDIAFVWHAHMLSPLRYFEDNQRNFYHNLQTKHLRLEEFHKSFYTAENAEIQNWKKHMGGEPYRLTSENLLGAPCPNIQCIVCSISLKLEWDNYAEWRTDPTVAIQCHRCDAMFTIKHVGKFNLATDLIRRPTHGRINAAGLMFTNYHGYYRNTNDNIQPESVILLSSIAHRIKFLPFNSGLNAIEDLINKKHEKHESNIDELRAEAIDAIKSTYMCSPYKESSIDLIHAVSRLYKFAFKVIENMEWNIPNDIFKGIYQYLSFIKILQKNRNAIPTIHADILWHTRMIEPENYLKLNLQSQHYWNEKLNYDRVPNHDNIIPGYQVQQYAEITSNQWKLCKTTKMQDDVVESISFNKKTMFPSGVFKLKKLQTNSLKGVFFSLKNTGTYQDYSMDEISVHGEEDVEDFVTFQYPYNNLNGEFSRVHASQLGFIGTISGEDTKYLNRWKRTDTTPVKQEKYAADSNYATYSKVFPSNSGTQILKPNSTEDPWFHWQKARIVWTYAKTKQEVDASLRKSQESTSPAETTNIQPPVKGYFTIYNVHHYKPLGKGF